MTREHITKTYVCVQGVGDYRFRDCSRFYCDIQELPELVSMEMDETECSPIRIELSFVGHFTDEGWDKYCHEKGIEDQ